MGGLSNAPLKERIANQNKLNAFAKIGKDIDFPNDFIKIIPQKPNRSPEEIAKAVSDINLEKDRIKYALLWFINGSPMDEIALRHLQDNNRSKTYEILLKKETYSSLINLGVLAFINDNIKTGFDNISKVIHNSVYRAELFKSLGTINYQLSEN